MLVKLTLENYRGFRKHSISFGKISIVVGRNNAGKSTIIEALRLVSVVAARARHFTYREPPEWLDIPLRFRCVTPSLRGMDFDYRNLHYQYKEPPSIIRAYFESGEQISIFLNSEREEIFATIYEKGRNAVTSKSEASHLKFNAIEIMPQTGLIAKRERLLNEEYVRSNLYTNLSPLHFRNQLHIFPELFDEFRNLTESTWPHLQVKELHVDRVESGEITLLVRDGIFVAEVGWLGQGLQSWLQTTWFLSRVKGEDTVVFDEPDVFLHADLQRKLVRFLTQKYRQTIIATHSLEIISDVPPENIIVVDRESKKSDAAPTLPAVQTVIDNLGGSNNLQLMRLWNAKRCIFVEGDDMDFLDIFHSKLYRDSENPLKSIPNIPLGGGGNWQHAVGAAIGFKNAGDEKISAYCFLDRDYKTDDEVDEIERKARAKGLELVFWKRKEIENYVLVPDAIRRLIVNRKAKQAGTGPKISTIGDRLDRICNEVKQDVVDFVAGEILRADKSIGLPTANRKARMLIEKRWSTLSGKLAVVPGKKVVSELSKWSKKSYNISFSALSIARELKVEEIDDEIRETIEALECNKKFSRSR